MNDYKKLSGLYAELHNLFFMKRNISQAKVESQFTSHLFKLDVSPYVNSCFLMGDKTKYKNELLHILDNEIKERQQAITQLTSDK